MKKVTKFFMAALLAGMCSFGYAQDYLGAPKANEKVLEILSIDRSMYYKGDRKNGSGIDNCPKMDWYKSLLEKAKQKYPNKVVDIRGMEVGRSFGGNFPNYFYGPAVGKVVYMIEAQTYESLSQALNKALRNVREGSRMAIDQVSVTYGMDKETLKDQLLDVLLDKGYKVIAKEYLEKLYEEQEAQQSGIYNENTTVKDNNFSAVGYYINVKVTETSLRVQVVNVSTGEYEGNATINF